MYFLEFLWSPNYSIYSAVSRELMLSFSVWLVKKVSGKTALLELMAGESDQYDFCMCNPPFFADHMEAQAITSSRTDDRAEPTSINTASVGESITEGGEVEFIHKIIVESIKLQGRIK